MIIITQDYISAGRRNRPGKPNPCTYITIHNTGNTAKGADAKSHASYIKSDTAANAPVSWHYTVDEAGVYQHLPDNETAYHAGDGSGHGNTRSIGIEICMNSDGDLLRATCNAAELTANLCGKHNIPIENVVQHNRWSGKNCPQMIRACKPFGWGTFIAKTKAFINAAITTPNETTVNNLIADGVITDSNYWLGVLNSVRPADPEHLRILFDRYHAITHFKHVD